MSDTEIDALIAQALRDYCKAAGMTNVALAARLGVTRGFVSQLINGHRSMSQGMLRRLPPDVARFVLPVVIDHLQDRLEAALGDDPVRCPLATAILR